MAKNKTTNDTTESKPQKTSIKINFLSILLFTGIGLTTAAIAGFTLYAWDAELKKESQLVQTNFQEVSTAYINQISSQIDVTMEILPTTALYSSIVGALSQDAFFDFSTKLFDRYNNIAGLAWAPLVKASDLPELETSRSEEGFPGYKVISVDNDLPLPQAKFHTPILYQEFSRDHAYREEDNNWMGKDMQTRPEWAKAMQLAVDTNSSALSMGISEPVRLLAFHPVYKSDSTIVTVEERQKNLIGYIVAQLDPERAINNATNTIDPTLAGMINLGILDQLRNGLLVRIFTDKEYDKVISSNLESQRLAQIYGRTWRFDIRPTELFLNSVKTKSIANWILIGGLALAALTFISLISMATRNKRIAQLVKLRTAELVDANVQIRESEALLMQSEKMSALGQMVAGVAHELNTPLGYVRSNLEVIHDHFNDIGGLFGKVIEGQTKRTDGSEGLVLGLMKKIDGEVDPSTMTSVCKDSLDGVDHLSNIVTTLKSFSRMDKVAFEKNSVVQCMESSLLIAHSQLKHKVEIAKQFEEVPDILCNASEINQVFLNLLLNAADAIEDMGTIDIKISPADDGVVISVIDSGAGIPDDVRKKIFEPFYTTKDVGKGTGLGLFICNRIITAHGGRIDIITALDQGTEFRVFLPLTPPSASAA